MSSDDNTIDFGTKELQRHFTVVPRLTRGLYGYNARVMDETEIDRLLLKGKVDPNQHATLQRFMTKLHKMGFVGLRSPAYDAPVALDPSMVGDRKANMIRGMVRIIAALDKEIGPPKRKALVSLVLQDVVWSFDQADLSEAIKSLDRVMSSRKVSS